MRTTTIHAWMTLVAESVKDRRDYLTQLDAAIGDGDHGVNMDRGFDAVGKALAAQDGAVPPGKLLTLAGKTLVSTVGGASGPLWGTAVRRAGRALGDAEEFDGQDLLAAEEGARATVPLQAKKGRASYLGERSIGHQDPGATSAALIMAALQRAVEQES